MAEQRQPPFVVDPRRLYEVGRDGTPRTDTAEPPEWLGPRHLRLLGWAALGAGLTGGLAALSVACLALGARLWAAGFALAVVAASPLLVLGPVLDWWRHRRPRRQRHRSRPEGFPESGPSLDGFHPHRE
ncbi:hypothetical protein GCM10011504_04850 [Siccirubricoccus deserti]|uniref:Uncharacterized protein n=1 Tax=Siccirubricoccus deserti TaxID=2013562 RepID=A0A9X0UBC7_9PROT|nr:hypothetical protein [Siccirubricoccus deserti]MBC4013812.1 hypothetical protein [Siccirubricoccus deserti]GGC29651.1 hypothetical protein GCM10011504_04850 [Siccirubricoccus deserti]